MAPTRRAGGGGGGGASFGGSAAAKRRDLLLCANLLATTSLLACFGIYAPAIWTLRSPATTTTAFVPPDAPAASAAAPRPPPPPPLASSSAAADGDGEGVSSSGIGTTRTTKTAGPATTEETGGARRRPAAARGGGGGGVGFLDAAVRAGTDKVLATDTLSRCGVEPPPVVGGGGRGGGGGGIFGAEEETRCRTRWKRNAIDIANPRCRPRGHSYDAFYERWLGPLSGDDVDPFQLLEIGFYHGQGYETFESYLPRAEVHSVEKDCGSTLGPSRLNKARKSDPSRYDKLLKEGRLHCGSATNHSFFEEVWADMTGRRARPVDEGGAGGGRGGGDGIPPPPPLRVVIDDASHVADAMVRTVFFWFPRLAPGGLLIVEDVEPLPAANAFRTEFLPQLMRDVHYCGDPLHADVDEVCFPTLQPLLRSVHCEMHICVLERNDAPPATSTGREMSVPPPHALDGSRGCGGAGATERAASTERLRPSTSMRRKDDERPPLIPGSSSAAGQTSYPRCETKPCERFRRDVDDRTVRYDPSVDYAVTDPRLDRGHWNNDKTGTMLERYLLRPRRRPGDRGSPVRYGEIGVFKGDSFQGVVRALPPGSEAHIFDFATPVNATFRFVGPLARRRNVTVIGHVVPGATRADYNPDWMRLCLEVKDGGAAPFDFVYVDSAHTFQTDALAFVFVDCALRPGGLVAFDDYDWTMSKSSTTNTEKARENYPSIFVEEPQVHLVVEGVVKRLYGYETVVEGKLYRKPVR